MLMTKSTIVDVNKNFSNGNLINKNSLEFAIDRQTGCFGNLPYITRALLVDHCFEDGNKRTALYLIIRYFETNRIHFDQEKLFRIIRKLTNTNENRIEKIRGAIKYATR